MLEGAVKAGKRVRSETDISKGSVSISSAAAELSEIRSMQGESGERRAERERGNVLWRRRCLWRRRNERREVASERVALTS